MVLKLLCSIAFFTPEGKIDTGYTFNLAHYELWYGTADLVFSITGKDYKLVSSAGVCTMTTFKEEK